MTDAVQLKIVIFPSVPALQVVRPIGINEQGIGVPAELIDPGHGLPRADVRGGRAGPDPYIAVPLVDDVVLALIAVRAVARNDQIDARVGLASGGVTFNIDAAKHPERAIQQFRERRLAML